MRLAGTVAVVTGATGGIGAAVVSALRESGVHVSTADRTGEVDHHFDVTDISATRRALAEVAASHSRLDIVVAASGIAAIGLAEEIDDDEWRREVEVNLLGALNTVRAGYDLLRMRGAGHLVAIASLAGVVPTPLLVPYAASKAGLVHAMQGLRLEAARHGVGVSAICPGPVDTPLLDATGVVGGSAGMSARRFLMRAAGRAIAPERVGAAVVTAVTRNRAIVAPGAARFLHLGARLNPRVAAAVMGRAMKRELAASASR